MSALLIGCGSLVFHSMQHANIITIQRNRKSKHMPPERQSYDDITIPPIFQFTTTNQQFVLYDNNNHQK
jgi:hypothetical protein